MRFLEKGGRLNRAIEFLPTDDEIAERSVHNVGLTTPERAVLLAYSKMWLFDEIIASDLPEDPWIGSALERYFPASLRQSMAGYIPRHPLKREIVATHVLNSMINRVGSTFVHRLADQTGAKPAQVVRAYLCTREVMGHVALWRDADRVLISGDAFCTTAQESAYDVAVQEAEMHGPPMYFTVDWDAAEASVATLAALEPEIALSFHGRPMQGAGMRAALHRLATGFRDIAVPREGRYLDDPRRAEDGSAYEKP